MARKYRNMVTGDTNNKNFNFIYLEKGWRGPSEQKRQLQP